MRVHLELDTAVPEDREILALIFGGQPSGELAPRTDPVTEDLELGRDVLRAFLDSSRESQAFPDVRTLDAQRPGWLRALFHYVAACGGLVVALEAVGSGPAALSTAQSQALNATARRCALELVAYFDSIGLSPPDAWRQQ